MRHARGRIGECHLVARSIEQDKVRELRRTLYRAAKTDPGRRFHALYDKVSRRDVLERAWGLVRANKGAAGIDRQTIVDVEQYGVSLCWTSWPRTCGTGAGVRFRRAGYSYRSPGVRSFARSRFPPSATASSGPL